MSMSESRVRKEGFALGCIIWGPSLWCAPMMPAPAHVLLYYLSHTKAIHVDSVQKIIRGLKTSEATLKLLSDASDIFVINTGSELQLRLVSQVIILS